VSWWQIPKSQRPRLMGTRSDLEAVGTPHRSDDPARRLTTIWSDARTINWFMGAHPTSTDGPTRQVFPRVLLLQLFATGLAAVRSGQSSTRCWSFADIGTLDVAGDRACSRISVCRKPILGISCGPIFLARDHTGSTSSSERVCSSICWHCHTDYYKRRVGDSVARVRRLENIRTFLTSSDLPW